jgi:hypothetical protein
LETEDADTRFILLLVLLLDLSFSSFFGLTFLSYLIHSQGRYEATDFHAEAVHDLR